MILVPKFSYPYGTRANKKPRASGMRRGDETTELAMPTGNGCRQQGALLPGSQSGRLLSP